MADPWPLTYRIHQPHIVRCRICQRVQRLAWYPLICMIWRRRRFNVRSITQATKPVPAQRFDSAKPCRSKSCISYQNRRNPFWNDGLQTLQKCALSLRRILLAIGEHHVENRQAAPTNRHDSTQQIPTAIGFQIRPINQNQRLRRAQQQASNATVDIFALARCT